jgi:hypothetical protein
MPKSTGFLVNTDTKIITKDKAILKLNRTSNKNAGIGKITMPIIANKTIGAPKPDDTDLNWFLSNRPK